jgi:hypothetical protein
MAYFKIRKTQMVPMPKVAEKFGVQLIRKKGDLKVSWKWGDPTGKKQKRNDKIELENMYNQGLKAIHTK